MRYEKYTSPIGPLGPSKRVNALSFGHHTNCQHYNPIKVFKITPGKDLNPCCEKDPMAVVSWLAEADDGIVTVEIIKMTPEDYDALPEYIGP